MSEPVVSLVRVTKAYRANWSRSIKTALSGVDLEIYPGESVGFIGHNGAGKSTTIRIILGLQRPTGGEVRLRGVATSDPACRMGVAYLPENPLLYDYLTPLELLEMGVRMHALDVTDLRVHCLKWLERFGISGVANRQIRTFSKGMMQRTALAHAMCCEPEFLILDEPLSGLDPIGRKEVVNILEEFRGSGRTLFFSSHVLSDVERLADRFVFIHDGRIRAICSTADQVADGGGLEVIVESKQALEGYESVSARLWKRDVVEADLPELLQSIFKAKDNGVHLYSVKTKRTLEQAYLGFVRSAEEKDRSDIEA